MLQYLRKAVSGSHLQDPRNNLVRDEYRKKLLKDNLAQSIKKLQKTYVNSDSPIIERNDEFANKVCIALEAIFLHEYMYKSQTMDLKNMFVEGIRTTDDETLRISFWELLKEVTHKDVITQLKHLVVTTDVGLCRSWVRLALNDCLIVSYLDAILANKSLLSRFYASNAFLMDAELPFILKDLLQGLMNFEFRLNYNSSKLNNWEMEPLELAGIVKINHNTSTNSIGENQSSPTAKLKDVSNHNPSIRSETKKKRIVEIGSDGNSKVVKKDVKNSSPVKQISMIKEIEEPKAKKIIEVESLPILGNRSFLEVKQDRNKHEVNNKDNLLDKEENTEAKVTIEVESTSEVSDEISETSTTQNTTDESIKEISETTDAEPLQPRMIGNRLGGNGWSGWSSQFEVEEVTDVDEESTPTQKEEFKSFDSLLQIYGNKTETISVKEMQMENDTIQQVDTTDGESKQEETKITNEPVSPTRDPELNQTFEVVPMDISLQGSNIDKKTQSSLSQLTELGIERGLDKQSFQCVHCSKAIGLIYGPYRVCFFDGSYYCLDCHEDEVYYIPAKVIQQWDFKKFKVSKYNKVFLMKIEEEPLFHMDELNPQLYDHVMSLKEVKLLRQQLQYVKEYVQTCRHEVAEDFRIRLWPREYLCDDIHQYSLLDLIQVHNGQLSHHLRKVISQFTKHIYKCTLCCQKGFICEYCHDEKIIYPFQINIAVQCPGCLSTFHRACRQDKRCPKCVRIHLRSQSSQKDEMERRLTVATKENVAGNVF